MIIAASIFFCVYIVVVFRYITHIFGAKQLKPTTYGLLIVLNSFLILVPIYVTNFRYETVLMLAYCLVFALEILVIYKQNLVQSLFGMLSFAINFFAIRTLVITIMSLVTGETVASLLMSEENRVLITAINVFVPIPYILSFGTILKHQMLNLALSDTNTSRMSTVFLGVIFINQIAVFPSIYKETGDLEKNLYYHIATAIFSIAFFLLVMCINYIYSNLKTVADTYSSKIEELRIQDMQIKDIENRSSIDSMTGFYVRDVAIKQLEEYLSQKTPCFVVFIDLDELKTVNDTYGHNEGDIYIKAVSDKIQSALSKYIVARIGGDEFLVVGKITEAENIIDIIEELERDVAGISQKLQKPYRSSISYGVQKAESDSEYTTKDLIAMADEKMYNYKRSRNKNRE